MKSQLCSMLIFGSVFSLANLVGPELEAQVVAAPKPAAAQPPAAQPAAAQPPAVHLSPQQPFDKVINSFAMDHAEKSNAGYVYWFFDKQFTGNGKTLKLSVVRP